MRIASLIPMWLLILSCFRGYYARAMTSGREPNDVKEFFDKMEKIMDKVMIESKSETANTEPRRIRYPMPEAVLKQGKVTDNIFTKEHKLADTDNNYPPEIFNPSLSSEEMDTGNRVLNFEGYQDVVFRPLYRCDLYESSQRHCVFRRQLGTTLTLGVEVGEGLRTGIRVYWYRCLRKKYFDHIIKEPLNKGFLPWNLNLGGSGNELRISPISEMDVSYNYFIAELVTPGTYRGKYGHKSTIRFDIETIEIDMGSLYHGEEIVIYARSFMELPRTSVNFFWSLQESGNFDDHGLPSNMQLNADKSSVIIKELKTYQNQYLICKAYSNKDFLLAKRIFLLKGFGNNKTSDTPNHIRLKRDTDDLAQPYDESNQMQYEEIEDPSNMAEAHDAVKVTNAPSKSENILQQVPGIAEDLFYDSGRYGINRPPNSYDISPISPSENSIAKIMRRFVQQDTSDINKQHRNEKIPEKPRFEDIESQTIAACRSHSDCNVNAICTQSSFSGEKFCQCLHGFNGNGLFCFSS